MTVLFTSDYGSGADSTVVVPPWYDVQRPTAARMTLTAAVPGIVGDPARPVGRRVMRVELRPYSATNPGTTDPLDGDVTLINGDPYSRSEVAGRLPNNPNSDAYPDPDGSERWYSWSTYIPPDFPIEPTGDLWFSLTQWKGWRGNSPPIFMGVNKGNLVVDGVRTYNGGPGPTVGATVIKPIPFGRWVRYVVGIKWSSDPAVGWLELRVDGVLWRPRTFFATMQTKAEVGNVGPTSDPTYLKQGIYRHDLWPVTHVLYHSEIVLGDTRLDVDSDATVLTPTTAGEYWGALASPPVVLADPALPFTTGLLAHYKPNTLTAFNDGDTVTTWPDSTGTWDAGQATPANRPIVKTNQINGYPALRFDGTNDSLGTAAITHPTTYTMFVVAKAATAAADTQGMLGADEFSSLRVFQFRFNSDTLELISFTNDLTTATDTQPSVTRTAYAVWTGKRSASVVQAYKNGASNGSTAIAAGTAKAKALTIGRSYDTGAGNFAGDIAEVIYFSGALSDTDRGTVEAYLASKYGL
jgi:hypothetical protein